MHPPIHARERPPDVADNRSQPRWAEPCEPLSDPVWLRFDALGPCDSTAITLLHDRLSAASTYSRYFCGRAPLRTGYVERVTTPEPGVCEYIGVFVPDRPGLVGLAGYHAGADAGAAELAVLVEDAHQGKGLGTLLVRGVAVRAAAAGLTALTAVTLPENRRMRHVLIRAGFEPLSRWHHGLMHVTFPVARRHEGRADVGGARA